MEEKTCNTCKCNKICDHNKYGFDNCENHISDDVVEVVRCKDCKYWTEEKDLGMFCSHWGSMLAEPQADDFCSYGERKG